MHTLFRLCTAILVYTLFVPAAWGQTEYTMEFDSTYCGGDCSTPKSVYILDLPTTPGVICIFGNNYSQPDRIELLDSADSVLFDAGYIGFSSCDTPDCSYGPAQWHDGELLGSTLPESFFVLDTSGGLLGCWALLWNTTGMSTIRLRMKSGSDGSSWSVRAHREPLPLIITACNQLGIVTTSTTAQDTTWYPGNYAEIPLRIHGTNYIWKASNAITKCNPSLVITPDTLIYYGQRVFVSIDNGDCILDWHWSDMRTYTAPVVLQPEHDVTISLINDCFSLSQNVHVRNEVYLPNVLTLDDLRVQSNQNARWMPYFPASREPIDYRWCIYDRQGRSIASGSPGDSWDGTYMGKPLEPAVYLACVSIGGTLVRQADVTLIR